MKKLFAIFLGSFLSTTSVYAAFDFVEELLCVNNAVAVCGDGYTHGSGCSANGSIGLLGDTGYCGGCKDIVNTTIDGITATTTRERQITCNDTDKTYSCGCRVTSRTYSCAEGYNGTCTNPSDINTCNCTQFECPENSTCTSATDVICNNGYYQKESSAFNAELGLMETTITCVACSENGTCTNNEIRCNAGYYRAQKITQIGSTSVIVRGEYVCTQCPEGKSSDAGAIGSAECYIPAGTAFTTEIGNGFYSVNCFPE